MRYLDMRHLFLVALKVELGFFARRGVFEDVEKEIHRLGTADRRQTKGLNAWKVLTSPLTKVNIRRPVNRIVEEMMARR